MSLSHGVLQSLFSPYYFLELQYLISDFALDFAVQQIPFVVKFANGFKIDSQIAILVFKVSVEDSRLTPHF